MAELQPRHEDRTEELPDPGSPARLVIRVELPSEQGSRFPPEPERTGWRALPLAIGGVLLVALGWIAWRSLSTDEPSQQAVVPAVAPVASPRPESPPAIEAPARAGAPPAAATGPAAPARIEPAVSPPAAPDSTPLEEVLPQVPRSALDTIRGTVRVAVRLTLDPQGTVSAVTSEIPGPSRYFERLSLEAARKWRFAPAAAGEPRVMRVRFDYTRSGVTARAEPVPGPG